ncbi:MAG: hypothetical protein HOV81_11570 [Kofleriaceae bacterium]|nr:hypothetical protein [Kofleriaceae bacterium]
MNIKAFYVDALGSALEQGIGTPADILRHVTPDVLSAHLPRPLWARLLTACLGAPNVDAQLVIETIGVPNLCEHVPSSLIWSVIADIAARALGKPVEVNAPAPVEPRPSTGSAFATASRSVLSPPPDVVERPSGTPPHATPIAVGPSIPAPSAPIADLINELEQDDRPVTSAARPRSPTAQRFRQSNTNARGTLGSTTRRPQAVVPSTLPTGTGRQPRQSTEVSDAETETAVGDWPGRGPEIPVDDSQLVEWKTESSGTAITGDDDFSDLGNRKR